MSIYNDNHMRSLFQPDILNNALYIVYVLIYLFFQSKEVQFNMPKINIIKAKEIQKKEHSI